MRMRRNTQGTHYHCSLTLNCCYWK
jgi:hypothetical protein